MSTVSKKKRPRDPNELAFSIVQDATDPQPDQPTEDQPDPHFAALGRQGGLKGGKARAEKLTPEQRKAIAKQAAEARWGKGA